MPEARVAVSSPLSSRTAVRGTVVTAFWTLFSRVLGFARDALMAAVIGVSPVLGAFSVAWIVPNLFRRLFGEGAVSAAVQPALARSRQDGGEPAARLLFARFHGFTALIVSGVVIAGEIVLWLWYAALPSGGDPAQLAATRQVLLFSALLLPYAVPICMTAVATAPQYLCGRFLLPAAAPVLLNLIWILAILLLGTGLRGAAPAATLLCWIVLASGILQWLLQAAGLRQVGYPVLPNFAPADGAVRRTMRSFLPALAGLTALQLNLAVDQALIWRIVGAEANSYAYLANRLLQLPLALIAIAAATGTLPLFARLAAERRHAELSAALAKSLESTLLLILAACAGMYVLAGAIVKVLFEHGAFLAANTELLAKTVRAYLWCLPAASLSGLLVRARHSRGDYRGPALAAALIVPVNLLLDLLLLPRLGVAGAGYATAVSLSVQTLLLLIGLPALGIERPLAWRRLPRLVLPGAAAAAAAWLAARALGPQVASVPGLALAILAGVAAAAVLTAWLLPGDFRALWAALLRRAPG